MSKVLLVSRYRGDIFSQALLADGKLLEFKMGSFVAERPMEFDVGSFVEVDVVSLLVQDGLMEIATSIDGVFTKCDIDGDPLEAVKKIPTAFNNKVFVGVRRGVLGNKPYTQYLFAFTTGSGVTNERVIGVINNG